MRKIVLFLLTSCVLYASCEKIQKQPLNYTVTNDANVSGVYDVYLPDTGVYTMSALVKFLNGYPEDSVMLVFSSLPQGIKVTPDSFSAVPTYTTNFTFYTNHMAHGTYQVALTANTPTQVVPRVYNLNLIVVSPDAGALFYGSLSDSNACTARNYKFGATGTYGGQTNVLNINNFGGYGTNVNVLVYFNQQDNTLFIPNQTCGNGSTVSGSGTYTLTQMIINYTATSTPTNPSETCTSIYTN